MTKKIEVTTPGDREIVVTREFDAPRDLIWDAHTKPDLVRKWMLGPGGWSMPVCDIDLKVGGEYRYVWRNDSDGSEFGFQGDYSEIDAPRRIVHAERFDGAPKDGNESVNTLTLSERNGRTSLHYSMIFPSAEVRDQALKSGMTDGMEAGYERLEGIAQSSVTA